MAGSENHINIFIVLIPYGVITDGLEGCCDEYEETERSSPGPPLPFVPQDVSQGGLKKSRVIQFLSSVGYLKSFLENKSALSSQRFYVFPNK